MSAFADSIPNKVMRSSGGEFQSAREVVVQTYEIFEAIVIYCDPCDMLRWACVCQSWNVMIQRSEKVRKRLCRRPKEDWKPLQTPARWRNDISWNHNSDPGVPPLSSVQIDSQELHLNLLLQPLLSKLTNQPKGNGCLKLLESYQRPEAIWRGLLIGEEAAPKIEMQAFLVGREDAEIWYEDVEMFVEGGMTQMKL